MTEEIMTTGEKFYILIQDIEEYIQHNSLEQDKELDFILSQLEELQSDYVRLEQENEELKKEIEKLKGIDGSVHPDSAYYKITRLEQENKELTKLKDEDSLRVTQLAMENTRLEKENENIINEYNKLQAEIINKDELKRLRVLLESGQKLAISTKEFERVFDEIDRLEQENKELKKEKQEIKSYLGIESKSILERLEEIYEWKDNDKLLLWKYRSALEEIKNIADKFDYWNNNLVDASNVINSIKDKIDEVLYYSRRSSCNE